MKPNLIYFGSPEFSANILESIIKSDLVNVVGVVTTPDMPQGRSLTLTPSPLQ
jgi:methionyl-tRNA formyltransferase